MEVRINGKTTDKFVRTDGGITITDDSLLFTKGGKFWEFVRRLPLVSKFGFTDFANITIIYEYEN